MVVIKLSKEDLETLLTTAQLSLPILEPEDEREVLRIIEEIQKQVSTN